MGGATCGRATSWLELIERIDLKVDELIICLDQKKIATFFERGSDERLQGLLSIQAPFQIRKRGVETKLIFANAPSQRDETLIKNIAKVQQMIDLAFLAPDIIRDVMDGTQRFGFTSDWCKHHSLPVSWTEQRTLIATL